MPTETIKALPPRSDVPRDQTWDIEALYDTPDAWSAEGDALARDLGSLSAHAGQLGKIGRAHV